MVRFIVALLALLASTAAMAEPQRQTFKDANGRTLGRSSTDARGNTTYYSMGRNTGRSVTDTKQARFAPAPWRIIAGAGFATFPALSELCYPGVIPNLVFAWPYSEISA